NPPAPNVFYWEINSAAGAAGIDPGWDLVEITGSWDASQLGSSLFVDILSVVGPQTIISTSKNSPGFLFDFDKSRSDYYWAFLKVLPGPGEDSPQIMNNWGEGALRYEGFSAHNDLGGGHFELTLSEDATVLNIHFVPGTPPPAEPVRTGDVTEIDL